MTIARHLFLAALLATTLTTPVLAAERTITLDVDNMTCASCPYIVKKSLMQVPGVSAADVSYEDKTATVTFDDAKTGIDGLTRATTNAGYPSAPRQ